MPIGPTRILPFALLSTALHAVVLVSVPERLDLAVGTSGDAKAVSVRLVAAGPAESGVESAPEQSASTQASADANRQQASSALETPGDPERPARDTASTAGAESTARTVASVDPEPAPEPEPEPSKTSDSASMSASGKAPERQSPENDTRASPAEEPSARASGADGTASRSQLASRARQEVTVRFRGDFEYPRIARRRGWEGRVVLSLRVHGDGRISDVEVVESSGRAVLDESARQTLIHIQRIPALSDQSIGEPLELRFPVTYRLQPA